MTRWARKQPLGKLRLDFDFDFDFEMKHPTARAPKKIEQLRAAGVAIPAFPHIEVPPNLEPEGLDGPATAAERQDAAALQRHIDAWIEQIDALYLRLTLPKDI